VSVGWLLLLFIVVPVVELALLIQLGRLVGTLATLALIVFTGALGAWLARRQGLGVLRTVRGEMADGRVPAGPLVDGALILVAGAVLMTPGVLTDAFGFFLLVPAGRRLLKAYLKRRFEHAVERGGVVVTGDPFGRSAPFGGRTERDVTPRQPPEERRPPPRLEDPD
jgi:UPF0716 protein FxsA